MAALRRIPDTLAYSREGACVPLCPAPDRYYSPRLQHVIDMLQLTKAQVDLLMDIFVRWVAPALCERAWCMCVPVPARAHLPPGVIAAPPAAFNVRAGTAA